MDMLNEVDVNIDFSSLDAYDLDGEDEDVGDEETGDDDEDVTEIDEGVFESTQGEGKKKRAGNYTEVEDVLLIKAWSKVGMDACTGTDQTGKRYWQHIEDQYCKLKPRTSTLGYRSYRSLQGRWDVIKPSCDC